MKEKLSGWKLVVSYLGVLIFMIGIVLLIPLLILAFYPYESSNAWYFVVPGVICLLIGYISIMCFRGKEKDRLKNHEDAILVTLFWIIAIIICAIPFMLTGKYNFMQSVFETTSGLTTTGLSVVDVSVCPHIFLFFRSLLLFVGGVGLVLVLTCAISDKYGLQLYNAEGHSDKLLPNLAKSARLILSIYSSYILLGTIAYVIAGMSFFDAINTSIASVSTGGFSTNPNSIGGYNSIAIEIITEVLMLLGGTNFVVHLFLLKRKFKKAWNHCETKFMIFNTLIVVSLLIAVGCLIDHFSFSESVRISFFQYFSCITTTGYQNVADLSTLSTTYRIIMICLMLIGGGMGSTAGGIKQYRVVCTCKGAYYCFRDKVDNHKVVKKHFLSHNGESRVFTFDDFASNASYVLIYLLIFALGSFSFTLFGYSLEDSMFEFASSIGTVGLSVGITGYNAHPLILLISTLGMFFGRLEIIVIFNSLGTLIRRIKDGRKEKAISD